MAYGNEALEIWRTSPPAWPEDAQAETRVHYVPLWHGQLIDGEAIRPEQRDMLVSWLLETEAVAVQAPDGHFVRRLEVLDYQYSSVHRGNCGTTVRAFYFPRGALWFYQIDTVS